jgi:G3E family GTPase
MTDGSEEEKNKKEGGGGEGGGGGGAAAAAAAAVAASKEAEAAKASPIRAVLRSKGFMWMSHSHATAFYWSHAGQHFEIRDEGDWWAAVPAGEWPEDAAQRAVILADFEPKPSAAAAAASDETISEALASRYGDRRQEIVFIGAAMDENRICEALDGALLTEAELAKYDKNFSVAPLPPSSDADAAADAAA